MLAFCRSWHLESVKWSTFPQFEAIEQHHKGIFLPFKHELLFKHELKTFTLSKQQGSNTISDWNLTENSMIFATGSVGTQVDKKPHFHGGEIKQVSRLAIYVGRAKRKESCNAKALKLETKLMKCAVSFKACGDLGGSKMFL